MDEFLASPAARVTEVVAYAGDSVWINLKHTQRDLVMGAKKTGSEGKTLRPGG